VTGLAVTAESSFPSMMRANVPVTGGQILPDLTRAVCGRSARSQCSVACIGMQATLAIVPWMPMMVAMLTMGKPTK